MLREQDAKGVEETGEWGGCPSTANRTRDPRELSTQDPGWSRSHKGNLAHFKHHETFLMEGNLIVTKNIVK